MSDTPRTLALNMKLGHADDATAQRAFHDLAEQLERELAVAKSVPAPSPLGDLGDVIAEYDRIVNGRLDPRDAEADFVMRGSDWRVIRAALGASPSAGATSAPLEGSPRELWLAKGLVSWQWEHHSLREPTVPGWQRYVREDLASSASHGATSAVPDYVRAWAEKADLLTGALFTCGKFGGGEHDPWFIKLPPIDAALVPVTGHADDTVDEAKAKFIVAACNRLLDAMNTADTTIKHGPHRIETTAHLICETCGADRLKEPCKHPRGPSQCPPGEAYSAQSSSASAIPTREREQP